MRSTCALLLRRVRLCQPVFDRRLCANTLEDMFKGKPVRLAMGQLDAVVGQDRVALVRRLGATFHENYWFNVSMRPRLLCLGYAGKPAMAPMRPLPRFNEAEAFTPQIRWSLENLSRIAGRASMRPRLLRLGYSPSDLRFYSRHGASMRPRLLRLGYRPGHRRSSAGMQLLQ